MRNETLTSDQRKDDTKENGKLLKNTLMYFRWIQQKITNMENGVSCLATRRWFTVMCCVNYIEKMDRVHYEWTFISRYEKNELNDAYQTDIELIADIYDIRFVFSYLSAPIFSNVFWTFNEDE